MFSPIPISVAMVGLPSEPGPTGARVLLERLAAFAPIGVREVQYDATRVGLRPRELDRSARRDIAALFRRFHVACSGIDLLIPSTHLLDRTHADRAIAGVLGAIELAGELAALGAGGAGAMSVSVALPATVPGDVSASLSAACERCGVRIADLAMPPHAQDETALGVGIDPAGWLSAGQSPVDAVAKFGPRLASARLSDIARGLAGVRCPPGHPGGSLDLAAFAATLNITGFRGSAVIDLRGVPAGLGAIAAIASRWTAAQSPM